VVGCFDGLDERGVEGPASPVALLFFTPRGVFGDALGVLEKKLNKDVCIVSLFRSETSK